jgi:hypothetical protein
MNDRDQMPGPGRQSPPDVDPDAPGGGGFGAALQNVRGAWAAPGGKLLAVVPAAAALVVGLVIGNSAGESTTTVAIPGPTVYVTATDAPQGNQDSASTSASTSTDGVPGSPVATGSVVPGQPVPESTGIGTVSLISLTPATGAWQSSDGSPMINGALQQFAIAQDLQDATTTGDLGYNLGRDYTRFTGLLGLDDNSPMSSTHPAVEIDGDGLKLASYTPTLGHPAQINVNVSGVLRLDIKFTSPMSENIARPAAVIVLGNGQLTTIPGYHPPVPTATR